VNDWLPELPPAKVSLVVYRVSIMRAFVGPENAPPDRAAWVTRAELEAAGVAPEDIVTGVVLEAVLPDELAGRLGL
jgi:hypothetical protein